LKETGGNKVGTKKNQHKVGTPAKPRGQQTGFAGNPDQNREAKADTPALRGRRQGANKMFSDASRQHVATDASKGMTNSPSIPAAMPNPQPDAPAERSFKRRMNRT